MLKKLQNNDKGLSSFVEKGLMFIVLFYFLTFILDLFFLAMTMINANHVLDYVTSKLQYQNGFIGSEKISTTQWTNAEIFNYINAGLENIGIANDEWSLSYKIDKNSTTEGYINLYNKTERNIGYITPNANENKITSLKGLQESNLYITSRIKLIFTYEYKFSGMSFKFGNRRSELMLYNDYMNLFIE